MKKRSKPLRSLYFKVGLLATDLLVLFITFAIVFHLRIGESLQTLAFNRMLWFFASIVLVCLYVLGTYDVETDESISQLLVKLSVAATTSLLLVILVIYLFAKDVRGLLGRGVLIGSFVVFFFLALSYRTAMWKWIRSKGSSLRWLLIASKNLVERFEQDLKASPLKGHIFFCSDVDVPTQNLSFKGLWSEFSEVVRQGWSAIILADDGALPPQLKSRLLEAKMTGHSVYDFPTFYEKYWQKVPVFYLQDIWFLSANGFSLLQRPVGLRIKRLFDLFLSFFMLLICWPIILLAILAIRLESRGEAIFRQIRTGQDGVDFKIFKLRSMRIDAEREGAQWASQNDSRITRVGKFIRLTRIDELPQLVNVFRGDMSFIGPRPERPEFNELLEQKLPYYSLRHLVRPGITGWAQINYPYGASVEDAAQKLQYDLYYIKNYTLILDLIIVLKTVSVVLFGRGR